MRFSITRGFRNAAVLAACLVVVQAAAPQGWFMAGSKPGEYDCNLDPAAAYNGQPSTYVRSKEGVKTTGFGTMMQSFNSAQYAGKRVRFSANVKSEAVETWAGLWMRVDAVKTQSGEYKSVAFDNMQDRPIKGTSGWRNYAVVLDVPSEATGIAIGILINGSGTVWMNGGRLEVVGPEVPTTGGNVNKPQPESPVNLDFERP